MAVITWSFKDTVTPFEESRSKGKVKGMGRNTPRKLIKHGVLKMPDSLSLTATRASD